MLLRFLRSLSPVGSLGLLDLTIKVVALMAVVSAQRGQMIHALSVANMVKGKSSFTFTLRVPLKHHRQGRKGDVLKFRSYPVDRGLCVVTALTEYLKRTAPLRGDHQQLVLTTVRPHRPASRDTVSRGIVRCVMPGLALQVRGLTAGPFFDCFGLAGFLAAWHR